MKDIGDNSPIRVPAVLGCTILGLAMENPMLDTVKAEWLVFWVGDAIWATGTPKAVFRGERPLEQGDGVKTKIIWV